MYAQKEGVKFMWDNIAKVSRHFDALEFLWFPHRFENADREKAKAVFWHMQWDSGSPFRCSQQKFELGLNQGLTNRSNHEDKCAQARIKS